MATEFGLLLPHEEGPGGDPVTWPSIRGAAKWAEDEGLDSVWLVDHVLWRGDPWGRDGPMDEPGSTPYGVTECWTTLAALAAATERVQLGTMVTCTAYRHPALLAKMADTVDAISDGRLILGLGAGDYPAEHEMLGVPRTDRAFARFEEALAIILPLLQTGRVEFEGEFYRSDGLELRPRGPRAHGPQIMIGSLRQGPRSLRLVSDHADLWNTWMVGFSPAELPAIHAKVDEACVRHGRDPATLRRSVGVPIHLGGPVPGWPGVLTGSDQEIAESLSRVVATGVDLVQLIALPTTPRTLDRLDRILALVAEW